MFFVFSVDRCVLVSQKHAGNTHLGSDCLSNYCYHTASSSSVSTLAFGAFSLENDRGCPLDDAFLFEVSVRRGNQQCISPTSETDSPKSWKSLTFESAQSSYLD
jgi:hypothetical protein